MEVFDIYYSLGQAQDPYPLTQVDFFHAKHRAIKKANAEAAAKGLPPPKTAVSYMDMASVRNFDHYDDIGQIPNDPVARDLIRREAMEAIEAKRRGEAASKAHKEHMEARKEKSLHADAHRLRAQQQRASAREETKRRVREAFSWQPRTFNHSAPAIRPPRKRKHAATAGNNEKGADSMASNSNKENSPAEGSALNDRNQHVIVHANDEDDTPSSKRSRSKSKPPNNSESLPDARHPMVLLEDILSTIGTAA